MSASIFRFILATLVCAPISVSACDSLHTLNWLLGSWAITSEKSHTIEQWHKVSDSTYEGSGASYDKSGNVLIHESLRLVRMQDQVFYMAKVSENKLPVAFAAQQCSPKSASFVNLNHDFPQRITYINQTDGIEVQVTDESGKGFTLNFTREESKTN